ncbi:class I SAM-dependent DNA methyltransferase [Novilysobacter arseniciresistens]|uniref:class I SAM-dependent DNA methyltransferase n=1 Tax=Novilysobacter arseniciresistens TaxID=1385522 RepID=UPI00068C51E3|nr:DNA methyltransferase [Lysobacter arseniciresistens]
MTPNEFIAKWRGGGKERAEAQSFFNDMCLLVGHKTPREADPTRSWFAFEYGAEKTVGGKGFADAWKKGFFGWEAKGTGRSLQDAYAQLKMYSDDLQNPPLLVVSDLQTIEIHTNFTNTVKEVHRFVVEDLVQPEVLRKVRAMFHNPEELRPGTKRSDITKEAAQKFADLAWTLRRRSHAAQEVAHFLNRLVFCMFAEDIGLLPDQLFTRMVTASQDDPAAFQSNAAQLFEAMRTGGQAGFVKVHWFNGGLFNDNTTLPLHREELRTLLAACHLSWDQIDPSIFGTLFERGLDPEKRSQLGAHYTDPETIMKVVRPVVSQPWLMAWEEEKAVLAELMNKANLHGSRQGLSRAEKSARTQAHNQAKQRFSDFLDRLRAFTILDPACGSGNFLFMSLRALKDLEHRVMIEGSELGLERQILGVGPAQVTGIELNEYAAELARITVWIGELQWMVQNGYGARKNPILLPLDQIQCRDALITGKVPAAWPQADVIVGNPPFIGNKKLLRELGEEYVQALREAYDGRVSEGADFVCYWFERAMDAIESGTTHRAGLVATNSIRGGANRLSLARIVDQSRIYDAWSDQEWWDKGTAVRVSLVAFGQSSAPARLDGQEVQTIYPDLHAQAFGGVELDLTQAKSLAQNKGLCFQGVKLGGPFEVPAETAREWLTLPNPHGEPNSTALRRWLNGMDLVRRPTDAWLIDFGVEMELKEAMLFEAPFKHLKSAVASADKRREVAAQGTWWRHQRPRPQLRKAIDGLKRWIATPEVSKHRVFDFQLPSMLPSGSVYAIARDDDFMFGVLQSKIHEVWALRMGTTGVTRI